MISKILLNQIKKIDICSENGMEIVGTKYFDNRSNGSIILVPDLKTIQKNLSNIFKELDVYKINKKPKQVDAILYESVNGGKIFYFYVIQLRKPLIPRFCFLQTQRHAMKSGII